MFLNKTFAGFHAVSRGKPGHNWFCLSYERSEVCSKRLSIEPLPLDQSQATAHAQNLRW